MKKYLNTFKLFLLTAVFLLFQVNPVMAHGGEDHGDEEETKPAASVVTPAESTGSKLFTGESVEVLVKYPQIHTNTPGTFQVFITDFKTNQPVINANVSLYFETSDSTISPVRVQPEGTDTPGAYQGSVTFEKPGNYRMLVGVTKGAIDESFSLEALPVESTTAAHETAAETASSESRNWLLPALLVLLGILLLLSAYLFITWTRKPNTVKDVA